MSALAAPTPELAARCLSEVGFEERLVLYELRRRMGPAAITVYSLAEALGVMASENFVPDYGRLADWIGKSLGDSDLASVVAKAGEGTGEETGKRAEIVKLIVSRLAQYREAARIGG